MYNQGNYQQSGQRLPALPPPPPLQQGPPAPHPYALASSASMQLGPPVSVPPSGMLSSSQSYLIPPPPPPPHVHGSTSKPYSYSTTPLNSDWSQSKHISSPIPPPRHLLTPRIPPPHLQEQHFYGVRGPPLLPGGIQGIQQIRPPLPLQSTSSYFSPALFGSFIQTAHESSLSHLPPPPPPSSPPPGPPPPPNSLLHTSSESLSTADDVGPGFKKSSVVDMVASRVIDRSNGDGSETTVKDTSDISNMSYIPPPPPRPRDDKIVKKIEVLCQYIAKNGHEFEDMICQKEVNNPEFKFLFGGAPGSEAAISHEYFKWMKNKCSSSELLEGRHNMDISLDPSAVGSSMQPDGQLHASISHSPVGSDMDMEDDITLPEEPGIDKSSGSAKCDPAFISNEVDITVEEHACHLEHISLKGATDGGLLDSKAEQHDKNLPQDMSQSGASAAAKVSSSEVPGELNRGTSPFRLIQGYASDISSENDNELHLENISPEAVSPQFKEGTPGLHDLQTKTESKNYSELSKGLKPLSVPVMEGSWNTASKIPEPFTRTKDLEKKTDSYLVREQVEQDGNGHESRAFVDGGTSITGFRQNEDLEGDDIAGPKNGGAQKKDSNTKLEVDEFGRMVKAAASDSESDDYSRRRGKRGRSRSRSLSPIGRRKRSPWRRRERRSRSRSWSPKKRSRSRSPYRYRGERNRSHLPICYDFRRGKCFRGGSCRYFHESEKSEESRRHKNKQQSQEISDGLRSSDKLAPEKHEVDNREMQLYQDVDRSSDRVKEELVEPPGHSAVVASAHDTLGVNKLVDNTEHPATGSAIPSQDAPSQLVREYNVMPTSNYSPYQAPLSSVHPQSSVPPASSWNPLPPPPPRPQLTGPLPQYQQNQLPLQVNYSLQAFVRPYAPPAGIIPSFSGGLAVPLSEGHAYRSSYGLQNPLADSISTLGEPGKMNLSYAADIPGGGQVSGISDFGRSRISSHYNPYASTFDQPLSTKFSSGVFSQDTGTSYSNKYGDQYDPLFDSIEPSTNSLRKNDHGNKIEETDNPGSNRLLDVSASMENDEFGETADAEVGVVENDSPSSPIDLPDAATGEIEIDQVKNSGKTKTSKDSRSMKLFKIALADFVKEVLKPSWRQGNMSKEAFKTIVKKTVDKVSGAMKKHQLPKSQVKINQYIESSQRKLTKLVMGYVDKYVKV